MPEPSASTEKPARMIPSPASRRPGIRNLLLALLGVAVFSSLGNWQLNRSAERRAEIEAFEKARAAVPAEGLGAVSPQGGYLRVALSGRYDGERQILMDNMTHEGRRGYHVLTPFHTSAGVVLVNRGFIPGGMDRALLPDVSVGGARRRLTGVAAPYFRAGLQLEEPGAGDAWPRRVTYPSAGQLRALIDLRLPEYQILLGSGEADGYVRAWQPYGMPPERHFAYAVQWYGLAAAAAGIWLAVTIARRRTSNEN